jgi:hypothetical protein
VSNDDITWPYQTPYTERVILNYRANYVRNTINQYCEHGNKVRARTNNLNS